MIHSVHHCEISTLNAEFNNEAFVTYTKEILYTEVKMYIICDRILENRPYCHA